MTDHRNPPGMQVMKMKDQITRRENARRVNDGQSSSSSVEA